jgi:putative membrane protein
MNKTWIIPLAAVAFAAAPALAQTQQQQTSPPGQSDTMKSGLTAESFARQALQSGEKEVAMAKLAKDKASNAEVKQLAEMIVQDHERVNEQLRLILNDGRSTTPSAPGQRSEQPGTGSPQAGQPGAAPPADVSPGAAPTQSEEYKKLEGLSGGEFDSAFLSTMVEGHEKSIELYQQATNELGDGAAKKLAEETLPKIRDHLQQAKSLQAEHGKKD